jgi:transcriptional regulator with XRE-family HTH domain
VVEYDRKGGTTMSNPTKVTTFQKRFSELFDESEKTTTDLAKDLHVSNQTVSAWKTGSRSPKEPTIIAIANHFGVSVAWLMGFDVPRTKGQDQDIIEETPANNEIRLLIRDLNKLSTEQIEQAKNIFRAMFMHTNPELFTKGDDDK